MNKKELFSKRRETLGLVRRSNRFGTQVNSVRFSEGETSEHSLVKFLICRVLRKLKKDFITEAIFENGKRADILVLDDELAIEVVKSEPVESIKRKKLKYPCDLAVYKIKENEGSVWNEVFITDFVRDVVK